MSVYHFLCLKKISVHHLFHKYAFKDRICLTSVICYWKILPWNLESPVVFGHFLRVIFLTLLTGFFKEMLNYNGVDFQTVLKMRVSIRHKILVIWVIAIIILATKLSLNQLQSLSTVVNSAVQITAQSNLDNASC